MNNFSRKCQVDFYDSIKLMTATAHAVIGTVIAAKIGNPYLAIPIAFASHIVADYIPHWDTATNVAKKGKQRVMAETLFDIALGFFISFILLSTIFTQTSPVYAICIILVSQSLDWLTAPYYFLKIKTPPFIWAYKFQKLFDHELDAPWGIVTQVVTIILLLVFFN